MLSIDEVRRADVLQWVEIRQQFEDADLLLGNGFSIQLASQFDYPSLFEKFITTSDGPAKTLFTGLETTNFEELQRILLNAKRVAELLSQPLESIDEFIATLREGLIKAINEAHPRAADIDKAKLTALSIQLDQFGNVFTTNYDLFLYHIIMISKDRHNADRKIRPYNDYFWAELNSRFLEFRSYQGYAIYKHVYYLHGALFIFPGVMIGSPNELKLRRGSDWELLDAIDELVRKGSLPLFVTEGTAAQKERAISRSHYLSFALDKLAEAKQSIVIYGSSMRDVDRHIFRALSRSQRSLAVSVYIGEKSLSQIADEVKAIRQKLLGHKVVVFDSRGLFSV